MQTLLLRLAAPLQSWGDESKFEIRRTQREPTKSGVLGMIASAMGKRRDEPMDELNELKFGIRVEKEGTIRRDFHMVHKDAKTSYLTYRDYLEDAVFLVGLASLDIQLLKHIAIHLTHPSFPLYLGRRSCPPSFPLLLGIREGDLLEVLQNEESVIPDSHTTNNYFKRIIIDTVDNRPEKILRKDVPVSYNPFHRQYRYRFVTEIMTGTYENNSVYITEHDPMVELE